MLTSTDKIQPKAIVTYYLIYEKITQEVHFAQKSASHSGASDKTSNWIPAFSKIPTWFEQTLEDKTNSRHIFGI